MVSVDRDEIGPKRTFKDSAPDDRSQTHRVPSSCWTWLVVFSTQANRTRPTERYMPTLSCLSHLGMALSRKGSTATRWNSIDSLTHKGEVSWTYLFHSYLKESSIQAFASSLPIQPTQRSNQSYKTGDLACWTAKERVRSS